MSIGQEVELVDDTIVRQAQRGDAWALDAVVRAIEPYLGRICGAIALEAGDDALQEALVQVITKLGSLREPAALWGWARRIAVREAVRTARDGRVVPVEPNLLAAHLPAVGDGTAAVDIRSVLAELSPEQRAVLILRDFDGVGEQEMAEILGAAVGTVKSRLSRARAEFRTRWTA